MKVPSYTVQVIRETKEEVEVPDKTIKALVNRFRSYNGMLQEASEGWGIDARQLHDFIRRMADQR